MLRAAVLCVLTLSLAAAAIAVAQPRSVLGPAPVAAIAADDRYVAFASAPNARDCDRVRVWNRTTGRVIRLGKTTSCEATSTGNGLAGLSMAGKRVLWLHFTGGNIREYQLFTATTTAPKPRRMAFAVADPEAPSPIVVGHGDASRFGDLLPVSVSRTVIALTAAGRRAFEWTAPRNVTALGARAGGLAVGLTDGRVLVFDNVSDTTPDGEWTAAPAASAVFVTGNGVAAQRGNRVELRSGDGTVRTRPLPAGSRLLDALGSRALYVQRGTLFSLDVPTGVTRRLARGSDGELEPGLVYANGRRVTALPAP